MFLDCNNPKLSGDEVNREDLDQSIIEMPWQTPFHRLVGFSFFSLPALCSHPFLDLWKGNAVTTSQEYHSSDSGGSGKESPDLPASPLGDSIEVCTKESFESLGVDDNSNCRSCFT